MSEQTKIVFFNGQEWEFSASLTAEDIRNYLMPSFPNIDRASYTVDEVTGNVTFAVEGGEKGR